MYALELCEMTYSTAEHTKSGIKVQTYRLFQLKGVMIYHMFILPENKQMKKGMCRLKSLKIFCPFYINYTNYIVLYLYYILHSFMTNIWFVCLFLPYLFNNYLLNIVIISILSPFVWICTKEVLLLMNLLFT